MFNIHDAFRGRAIGVLLLGILFFAVGAVVLGFSFKSDLVISSRTRVNGVTVRRQGPHQAGTGERLLFFAVGAIFATVGVAWPVTTVKWLRRASDLMQYTRPVPMLVTFRQEVSFDRERGRTKREVKLFATVRSPGGEAGATITDMPIDLGVHNANANYPDFVDEPGQVYLDRDPSGPVVITLRGKYWLSQKGFTRG